MVRYPGHVAKAIIGILVQFAGRLRFPTLFFITAAVFVVDVLVPDIVPFADELILGLATVLLGSLRKRLGDKPAAPKADSLPVGGPER